MKIQCIIVTIGCILTGISSQDNLFCHRMDFNKADSILEFEECSSAENQFMVQSYSDVSLITYGDGYHNFLTNVQPGWSCISTIGTYNVDENTEFQAAIYLQSMYAEDNSFIEFQIFNGTITIPVISTTWSSIFKWNEFYNKPLITIENAKVTLNLSLNSQ